MLGMFFPCVHDLYTKLPTMSRTVYVKSLCLLIFPHVADPNSQLAAALGAALGASLGGILSDSIGWRFAYFLPIPLTFFSIVVFLCRASPKLLEIQATKKNSFQRKDIDSLGSVLLAC